MSARTRMSRWLRRRAGAKERKKQLDAHGTPLKKICPDTESLPITPQTRGFGTRLLCYHPVGLPTSFSTPMICRTSPSCLYAILMRLAGKILFIAFSVFLSAPLRV